MMKTKRRSSVTKWLIAVGCILLAVTLAVLAAWWFLLVKNIAAEVTVEAGTQSVDANAYLIRDWDIPAAFVTDMDTIDLNRPGDYPVQLRYYDRVYDAVLRVRDTVSPQAVLRELTAVSAEMPEPEDFISGIRDATQVRVEYAEQPDMSREGEQTVTLLLTDESGNVSRMQATLTVIIDSQGPVIEGVTPLLSYNGQAPDYLAGVTITDDLDEVPLLTVDDSNVVLTRTGEYLVTYTGTDISGNVTQVSTTLTVIIDETAPSILGVNPISLYAGSTVSYRSGILVTDDIDEAPVLKIDSSGVDLSKAGTYEVTYIAADAAGNQSSMTTTVTVKEKTARYVEEETVYELVDQLLALIIKEDMTEREKVETVYFWITRNCVYYGASDKTDWLQAAYTMMVNRAGDCFNFYALSKLMFDRLELPNLTVRRCDNPYRRTSHYWNMVSVDGGETYYHFDTTPRSGSFNFCLVTDAYLENYDLNYQRGYYARDLSLYPATPEE